MPYTQTGPSYASYLQLDTLLDLQSPLSIPEHPDELHFVVTHQAMELWFRVVLRELQMIGQALRDANWTTALRRAKRANAVLDTLGHQLKTMTGLDPQAFLTFRGFLGSASALHSVQYRVIEVLSGLRSDGYLDVLRRHNGELPDAVALALDEPSVADLINEVPQSVGLSGWTPIYADPEAHGTLFLLAEELLDYDARWMQWRYEHLLVVERVIGRRTRGTGGALPRYLEHRVSLRFFPQLWEVRDELALEAGGKPRDAEA
jgi:tryptophan 2,3-dioxygenase